MKKLTPLDQTYDFFSAEMIEDIVVLKFRENLLVRAADLHAKGSLFEYLDNVSRSDRVKAVLIIGSPEKKGCEEYFEFYRKVFELQMDQVAIVRLYNAVNQFILKIMELNKIVVHADSGEVIPPLSKTRPPQQTIRDFHGHCSFQPSVQHPSRPARRIGWHRSGF